MVSRWSNRLTSLARVGFDSNALIYALEGRAPYASLVVQVLTMMEKGQVLGFASTLVEMEMLVKPMRDGDNETRTRIEVFLRHMPNLLVRPVDRSIARRAARLRARTNLPSIDSVIAATSIEERCDALIGNDALLARRLTDIEYLYLGEYIT